MKMLPASRNREKNLNFLTIFTLFTKKSITFVPMNRTK